jgi:hypothetical protein
LVADIYKPFLADGKYPIEDLNPFRLIKEYVSSINLEGRKAAREEFIMLDRANIGLFTKIKKWKASINWKDGRDLYQIQSEKTALEAYLKK